MSFENDPAARRLLDPGYPLPVESDDVLKLQGGLILDRVEAELEGLPGQVIREWSYSGAKEDRGINVEVAHTTHGRYHRDTWEELRTEYAAPPDRQAFLGHITNSVSIEVDFRDRGGFDPKSVLLCILTEDGEVFVQSHGRNTNLLDPDKLSEDKIGEQAQVDQDTGHFVDEFLSSLRFSADHDLIDGSNEVNVMLQAQRIQEQFLAAGLEDARLPESDGRDMVFKMLPDLLRVPPAYRVVTGRYALPEDRELHISLWPPVDPFSAPREVKNNYAELVLREAPLDRVSKTLSLMLHGNGFSEVAEGKWFFSGNTPQPGTFNPAKEGGLAPFLVALRSQDRIPLS